MSEAYITGFGEFLPGNPVDNDHIEDHIGIVGNKVSKYKNLVLRQNKIKTRYYASNSDGSFEYTVAELAAEAIKNAFSKSQALIEDVDFLCSSCSIHDSILPGLASMIHGNLDIDDIDVSSFQSVCGSSIMALRAAANAVKLDDSKLTIVTGSEIASRHFRPTFYENTDYFKEHNELPLEQEFLRYTLSDGAGAALVESRPNANDISFKVKWIKAKSFANRFPTCMIGGASKENGRIVSWGNQKTMDEAIEKGCFVLSQDLKLVYEMIPVWVGHYLSLIDQKLIVPNEIDHVVSHYSSESLKTEVVRLLEKAGAMISEDKWFSNLTYKGNTGSASIFILLNELFYSGKLKKGEQVLCHVPESGQAYNSFMLLEVV
ncbi:MAG: 3-oxoacyl-[acyl-carrier-protein] synthase III C-terminal domain-containing protein [Acidimicrobiia bacterium]